MSDMIRFPHSGDGDVAGSLSDGDVFIVDVDD